jgi:hypothetical protein
MRFQMLCGTSVERYEIIVEFYGSFVEYPKRSSKRPSYLMRHPMFWLLNWTRGRLRLFRHRQLTAYEAAFEAAKNPNRGKVDVLNKNETKAAIESGLRALIKAYLTYNPEVSDADKESMRFPCTIRPAPRHRPPSWK